MPLTRSQAWVWPVFLFLASCSPQATLEVPAEFKEGQKQYHRTCSSCHGSDAMGKHTKAPRLIDEDYIPQNFPDSDIKHTVINGTEKMPSQRNKVTDQELDAIIKYLRYSQKAADLQTEESEETEDEDEA